ncbi:MAG: helix-turn-helix domain-containing protein [Bacteroidota bacterium]
MATKADINEILAAIAKLQSSININKVEQKFLRSADVRKMLNISDSTLQRLRISGALKSKKVNGTWFYKFEDIQNIMEVQHAKKNQ